MSESTEQTNVKVMVRVRPFNSKEIRETEGGLEEIRSVIMMEGSTVRVLDHDRDFQEREAFEFDTAFWSIPESQNQYTKNPFTKQEDVFETTGKPAVDNALQGYHNTIFAYGQTGSGKTHTMLGNDDDPGIAPRLVAHLFKSIEEEKARYPEEQITYSVELSFLEIYNEKVKDLLKIADTSPKTKSNAGDTEYAECRVRFHPEKGTYVEGLVRLSVNTEEECQASIKAGMEHRAVTATNMNATSSRSHAIFQICLSQRSPLKGTTRVSIINLVDLAGSERIKMSGVTGQALQEAKNINLSLSTLRRVIDVLIDNAKLKKGQRPAVPPYRESLLTWVLSDSLGGNSKTMMIAAVSPYSGNIEDTMGTLRYALKAKAIVCNARVNEERTAAVVNALRSEMETLRKQLAEKADADQAEQERLQELLTERESEFHNMQEESKRLDDIKRNYEEELHNKERELQEAQQKMEQLNNIEEEKVRKEEELIKARELQAKTAALLKEQEEERRRKDEELEKVIARRNSLKRHHDRAAEEEAKARLAADQARLRQFASAFQNAFILGKQKTGLQELREEHAILQERVEKLRDDVATREKALNEMVTNKSLLQRKVELLEKRCQSMQHDLQEVLANKNEKIAELTARKAEADDELSKAQQELSRRRQELDNLRKLHTDDQDETKRKLKEMEEEHERVVDELKTKEERLAKLKELLSEGQTKLDDLQESSDSYKKEIDNLSDENKKRNERIAELKQRRALLLKQRSDATDLLAKRRDELENARVRLDEVTDEANTLRQNHDDLKQFVLHKFFPVANTRAPASPTGPGGVLGSPGRGNSVSSRGGSNVSGSSPTPTGSSVAGPSNGVARRPNPASPAAVARHADPRSTSARDRSHSPNPNRDFTPRGGGVLYPAGRSPSGARPIPKSSVSTPRTPISTVRAKPLAKGGKSPVTGMTPRR